MSTILKLRLRCQVVFMLTDNVYFVKIGWKFEKLWRFKRHIFESPISVTKHLIHWQVTIGENFQSAVIEVAACAMCEDQSLPPIDSMFLSQHYSVFMHTTHWETRNRHICLICRIQNLSKSDKVSNWAISVQTKEMHLHKIFMYRLSKKTQSV